MTGQTPNLHETALQGMRAATVYIVQTHDSHGFVRDLELLTAPPRWKREPGQSLRVAHLDGGDSLPIAWPVADVADLDEQQIADEYGDEPRPCAECRRPVVWDAQAGDYRHVSGPACALALGSAEVIDP